MSLEKIRKQIDVIDDQIIPLLQKRLDLVLQLKPYKTFLTDQKREKEIVSKTTNKWIHILYKEIFSLSKRLLKKKTQSEEPL